MSSEKFWLQYIHAYIVYAYNMCVEGRLVIVVDEDWWLLYTHVHCTCICVPYVYVCGLRGYTCTEAGVAYKAIGHPHIQVSMYMYNYVFWGNDAYDIICAVIKT